MHSGIEIPDPRVARECAIISISRMPCMHHAYVLAEQGSRKQGVDFYDTLDAPRHVDATIES